MSTVTIIVVSLLKTLSQYNSNMLLSLTWKISSSWENYQMHRALKTLIFLTISI